MYCVKKLMVSQSITYQHSIPVSGNPLIGGVFEIWKPIRPPTTGNWIYCVPLMRLFRSPILHETIWKCVGTDCVIVLKGFSFVSDIIVNNFRRMMIRKG